MGGGAFFGGREGGGGWLSALSGALAGEWVGGRMQGACSEAQDCAHEGAPLPAHVMHAHTRARALPSMSARTAALRPCDRAPWRSGTALRGRGSAGSGSSLSPCGRSAAASCFAPASPFPPFSPCSEAGASLPGRGLRTAQILGGGQPGLRAPHCCALDLLPPHSHGSASPCAALSALSCGCVLCSALHLALRPCSQVEVVCFQLGQGLPCASAPLLALPSSSLRSPPARARALPAALVSTPCLCSACSPSLWLWRTSLVARGPERRERLQLKVRRERDRERERQESA